MGTRIVAPGSESAVPQYAAHAGRITLVHQDTEPDYRAGGQAGATTWWKDGTASYVVQFRSGAVHGWAMADETDTAVQAVDSLREGEAMSPDRLWAALRDVRRLRNRLEALEAELILHAREDGHDGRPRMSLREIGDATQTHHTTVDERVSRMHSGMHAPWRRWLVQDTPRAQMYTGAAPVRVNFTAWDRGQDPAGPLCGEVHPDMTSACGRPRAHGAVPDDAGHGDFSGRRWTTR
ncbi:hypothetical protein [Streptomyces sp. NPDC002580]|uniref:hypothetical protein n=1 Tax=Streptomyces sp. NPDC002580 TaxID=3364653 RepID=UPI0036BCA79A